MSEKQTWTCDQLLNTNNWSVENFKKNLLPQWIGTWAGDTVLWDWSVDTYSTTVNWSGAFLREESDQDQWFEITRIMVDQMNRWIHSGQGFIGSFDLLWSEWSQITDPDPNHLKGTHPNVSSWFPCRGTHIRSCDYPNFSDG